LFQRTTLGAASERIPVAISWESMESIALSGDHGGITVPEGSVRSSFAQKGGTTC
jgi:hypothetical protein